MSCGALKLVLVFLFAFTSSRCISALSHTRATADRICECRRRRDPLRRPQARSSVRKVCTRGQVSGVEDRYQERLRNAMEYLTFRNISQETKRRVPAPTRSLCSSVHPFVLPLPLIPPCHHFSFTTNSLYDGTKSGVKAQVAQVLCSDCPSVRVPSFPYPFPPFSPAVPPSFSTHSLFSVLLLFWCLERKYAPN